MFPKSELKAFSTAVVAIALFLTTSLVHRNVDVVFSKASYVSLHIILELFSICVSYAITMQGLFSFKYSQSRRQIILSGAFLIIGTLDLVHTLSYKGMPFFLTESSVSKSTWFWVATRLTEAGFLALIFSSSKDKRSTLSINSILIGSLIYILLMTAAIVNWEPELPALVIEGQGVSNYKLFFEYIISLLHLLTVVMVLDYYKNDKKEYWLNIALASVFLLIGELFFTLYRNVYGLENFLGHIYKILGYWFILKGIYIQTVHDPFNHARLAMERFKKAFNANPSATVLTRVRDDLICDVNENFLSLFGYTRDEVVGRTANELQTWAEFQTRTKMVENLKEKGYVDNLETGIRKKSGEKATVLVSTRLIEIEGEQFIIGSLIDITNRKKIEEALNESEERFYKSFHLSPDIMILTEIETGRFVDINQSFLDCFKYTRPEVIGKTDEELIYEPEVRKKVIEVLKKEGKIKNFEANFHTKCGTMVTLLISMDFIEICSRKLLISSAKDITRQKQMEIELVRLDRLNIVGQMASGIAHEIRNPMTTVKGFLQLLANQETDARKSEYYDIIIDELDRANSIISEFLSLARDKKVELKPTSLNTIINALYPLLSSDAIKQDKRIILKKGEINSIPVNEKEIRQLILNLVRNGLEAMPSGTDLTIGTYMENDELILYVQDQGKGIKPEVLEKLGTPFITTKENGTGLGLAVCYSIVDRHDAKMEVRTGSSGTTFYVRFRLQSKTVNIKEAS